MSDPSTGWQAAPAWYPDPFDQSRLRWWDGNGWSPYTSPPPLHPATGLIPPHLSGFWRRVAALIIDTVIVGIPVYVIAGALTDRYTNGVFNTIGSNGSGTISNSQALGFLGAALLSTVITALIGVAAGAAYFIITIGKYGRTAGQAALGIRVIDTRGAVPGYGRAAQRWILPGGLQLLTSIPLLGFIAGVALLVDYLSMLWSDGNQCWHDQIAHTWVVRTRGVPRQPTS